jgi:hypothetical protein
MANKVIKILKPEKKAAKKINADIVYYSAFLLQELENEPINKTLECSLQYIIFKKITVFNRVEDYKLPFNLI